VSVLCVSLSLSLCDFMLAARPAAILQAVGDSWMCCRAYRHCVASESLWWHCLAMAAVTRVQKQQEQEQ
jgi:hypothetical protein